MNRRLLPTLALAALLLPAGACEIFLDFEVGESGAQCADSVDNDGNGLLDCSDPSCAGQSECGAATGCGDGVQSSFEACDDGGNAPADGCSPACTVEPGWTCTGMPSVCTQGEACDLGFDGPPGSCVDIDECAAGTSSCAGAATCTNTVGSFRCVCDAGFGGDGATCSPLLYLTQPPAPVNELFSGCDTDFSNSGRKAAVDGLGHLYAAMRCGGKVVVAASADRGLSWLEHDVGIADPAELAVQGGQGATVYAAAITSAGKLVFTVSTDAGASWAAPEVLGSGYDASAGLSLATAGPRVYVAGKVVGHVQIHENPNAGKAMWFTSIATVLPLSFDLLVDDAFLDVYLVGDDDAGPFVVPGARSRTVPGLAFGALFQPAVSHTISDWAWGHGRAYAVGSGAAGATTASAFDMLSPGVPALPLGEVPAPVARQRAVASDYLGNFYMASAFTGTTESELELHFAPASGGLAFSRALGPGRSPSIVGLPTDDGALIVFTSGAQVHATVQMAPEPSCAKYLGARNRGSGAYVIDPDGEGGQAPFGARCDMATDGGGWTMVHKLSTNVSASPQSAWFEMVAFNDSDLTTLDLLPDGSHYTNSIVTFQWNASSTYVSAARVAVYTGGVEKAFLQFSVPSMTDSTSWFAKANLVSSSWTDLAAATPDWFAISGNGEAGQSWAILRDSGVCQLQAGWIVVDGATTSCTWEDAFTSDISILYADPTLTPVAAEFESSGRIKEAETLIVWVR